MKNNEIQKLLTVPQLSTLLSCAPVTLRGWIRERKIEYLKIGKLVRFDPRSVERFIEAARRSAKDE